jgi:hypothetical protein
MATRRKKTPSLKKSRPRQARNRRQTKQGTSSAARRKAATDPLPVRYQRLRESLQAWLRVLSSRGEDRLLRLGRSEVETAIEALGDALEFWSVRPQWTALQTRYAKAQLAGRGKKGTRKRDTAFARAMGVGAASGKRASNLKAAETALIVRKYWELISVSGLVHHLDDATMWASGWHEQVSARPRPRRIQPAFPVVPPRPVVEAPIAPAEAVEVIRGWFPWRFKTADAVRRLLEEQRKQLKEERQKLKRSNDPADHRRLSTLPPADFATPGSTTLRQHRS